jgi:hypothetical protein
VRVTGVSGTRCVIAEADVPSVALYVLVDLPSCPTSRGRPRGPDARVATSPFLDSVDAMHGCQVAVAALIAARGS